MDRETLMMGFGRAVPEALSSMMSSYGTPEGVVFTSGEYPARKEAVVPQDGWKNSISPFLWGLFAGAALLAVYFAILTLTNSLGHALEELRQIGGWIFLLVIGFGTQVGLFVFMKRAARRNKTAGGTAAVAASGGVSTTAMVACCLHHVTDVLPVLGASAAAFFLIRYQEVFLAVGVISNLIGINIMLNLIQKYGYYEGRNKVLGALMKINMGKALWITSSFGAILLFAVLKKVSW